MNFYSDDRTLSEISGTYDVKKELLSFKEIKNISTDSKAKESEFCFISVQKLKLETGKNKKIIRGNFEATFPNGKLCANGKIYLVSAQTVEQIKKSNPNLDPEKLEQQYREQKSPNKIEELTAAKTLKIQTRDKEVKLLIWDGYTEDGDQVDIVVNGKTIAKGLTVTNAPKTFTLSLVSGSNKITVKAINNGKVAPNTAHVKLQFSEGEQTAMTRLHEMEETEIIIQCP